MLDLQLNPQTEQTLRKLVNSYQNDEQFAQAVIAKQIDELQKANTDIQLELKAFEQQYPYTTQQFYEKFQVGELGDEEDFMLWAGLYEMWQMNQKNLLMLAGNDSSILS